MWADAGTSLCPGLQWAPWWTFSSVVDGFPGAGGCTASSPRLSSGFSLPLPGLWLLEQPAILRLRWPRGASSLPAHCGGGRHLLADTQPPAHGAGRGDTPSHGHAVPLDTQPPAHGARGGEWGVGGTPSRGRAVPLDAKPPAFSTAPWLQTTVGQPHVVPLQTSAFSLWFLFFWRILFCAILRVPLPPFSFFDHVSYGLTCVPQNSSAAVLTPAPQNVAARGDGVFQEASHVKGSH